MKEVIQLNEEGYFVGTTVADESPLEPNVFLMPANTIEAIVPDVPAGKLAKWSDGLWVIEDAPIDNIEAEEKVEPQTQEKITTNWTYAEWRMSEYPPIGDQLDALFHAGVFPADMAAQIQAVKDKYPKA